MIVMSCKSCGHEQGPDTGLCDVCGGLLGNARTVLVMPAKGQLHPRPPRPPSAVRRSRAEAVGELHGVHTWGDGEIECHGNLNRWQLETIVNALTSFSQVGFPEGDRESEDRCNVLAELFARILREG